MSSDEGTLNSVVLSSSPESMPDYMDEVETPDPKVNPAGPPTSLFPAYNLNLHVEQNDENIPTSQNTTEFYEAPSSSLFPAYNITKPQDSSQNTTQSTTLDWLTNSSFASSAVQPNRAVQEPEVKFITEVRSKGEKKAKKNKRHKHKRKYESDDVKLKEPEKDESLYSQMSKMVFIEETGLASERAYREDKKPDKENFQYDSFYKGHIARYYQNLIVPLGVPGELENNLLQLGKKGKKLIKKEKDARYFSSKSVSQHTSKKAMPIRKGKELRVNEDLTYISIKQSFSDSEEKQTKVSDVNPLGIYDAGTVSYLAGVGKLDEVDDKNLQDQKRQTDLYKRTQKFNEGLRKTPDDENLWIEFVSFQDDLATSNPYESELLSNSANINKALLEKKLAILDRALASNPRMLRLAILRLDICSQIMQRTQVLSEWKKLTFVHAGNPDVWHHYIEFLKSSLTSFTVSSIVKAYIKAISTLNSILQGTFHTLTVDPKLEDKLLDLFSTFCWFLRESGLLERSIATYQAAIEFNLFAPSLPSETTFNEKVTFFEPFWDSGMSRAGEGGALGWERVFSQKCFAEPHTVGFSELNEKEDAIMERELSDVEYWLEFENLREKHHWLPWRPEEGKDEECEDPDRMVVLDDVSSVLFQLHSEKGKIALVVQFLKFLGVPCNVEWEEISPYPFSKSVSDKLFQDTVNLPNEVKLESLVPFISNLIDHVKPKYVLPIQRELDKICLSYSIKETLSNCQTKKELNNQIKNLKKVARNILKEENNRNDLYLWTLYAQLEFQSGKIKETFNVFDTIFSSHCGVSTTTRDLLQFSLNSIDIVLNPNDFTKKQVAEETEIKLKWYLTVLGAGDKYKGEINKEISSVLVLKAKNGYKTLLIQRDNSYTTEVSELEAPFGNKASEYTLCLCCYSYFNYFLHGVNAALETIENILFSQKTESGRDLSSIDVKLLGKFKVRLLTLHSSSLTLLRPALIEALNVNPEDITNLSLFIQIEGASYLSRQLRKFFNGLLNSKCKNSTVSWIYAIVSEWKRLLVIHPNSGEYVEIPQVGVAWKIRNLFEKALNISSSMHCPLIWRMYIKFEMEQGYRDKAKAIFYRSLQKCPGHKILYLDSAKYFPDITEEISDLLTEKEIRVRTPLEEIQLLLEHKKNIPEGTGN